MNRPSVSSTYPFPEDFYRNIARRMYEPVTMGENAVLLLPPYFGKDHLLHYLRERRSDRERIFGARLPAYLWAYGNIRPAENDEAPEWLEQMGFSIPGFTKSVRTLESFFSLLQRTISEETSHLVFVINVSEELKLSALMRFFALANKTVYAIPDRIHFIISLYQQWDDDEFRSASTLYNSLLQHTYRPGHRTDEEIQHFIRYRLRVWNHTLPRDAIDQISKDAGGIPLFAKAAVRIASRERVKSTEGLLRILHHHPEYLERTRLFLESLPKNQQIALQNIAEHGDQGPQGDITQLYQKRIIEPDPDGNGYRIRALAIQRLLSGNTNISMSSLCKDIRLTRLESRCLTYLISTQESVVSRKSLAEKIWGIGAEYSDWALDKLVSRLRTKLTKTKSGNTIRIVSEKGKGFYLHIV